MFKVKIFYIKKNTCKHMLNYTLEIANSMQKYMSIDFSNKM